MKHFINQKQALLILLLAGVISIICIGAGANLFARQLPLPTTETTTTGKPIKPPNTRKSALSDPLAPPKPAPLKVAHDKNYWPFSFKEKGRYVGFDLELWVDLAASTEVEYELVPMEFNDILPAIEAGKIDVGIAAIPINNSRSEKVLFSAPYFKSGLQYLYKKYKKPLKNYDAEGKNIAVQKGSEAEDFAKAELGTSHIGYYKSSEEMFFDLLTGKVDAVLADFSLIHAYLNITKNPALETSAGLIKPYNIAIAMPKGSTLQPRINKAFAAYRNTSHYKALCIKWFGEQPPLLPKGKD